MAKKIKPKRRQRNTKHGLKEKYCNRSKKKNKKTVRLLVIANNSSRSGSITTVKKIKYNKNKKQKTKQKHLNIVLAFTIRS